MASEYFKNKNVRKLFKQKKTSGLKGPTEKPSTMYEKDPFQGLL